MNIMLYSTGCPKCKVLKQKLTSKNIPFEENNSIEEMTELGISQVPVLRVDDTFYDFTAANKWVNDWR